MFTAPDPSPSPSAANPLGYGCLRVGGPDASRFLNGQLTQDVAGLAPDTPALAALLTPQGRVIAVPWIVCRAQECLLVLPGGLVPAVGDRLARYVLRAKVAIEATALPEALAAELAAALAARGGGAGDPAGGCRLDARALVRAGIAETDRATSEQWIPQMLNLDLVGAISFQKGCYTGQEIVARTQHLGRIKRRMFRLALDGGAPPPPQAAVLADGAKAGEVVLAAAVAGGAECLAVLNLEARERALTLADGRRCRMLALPYAVA